MTKKPSYRFAGYTESWERKAPVEVFCDFSEIREKSKEVGGVVYA